MTDLAHKTQNASATFWTPQRAWKHLKRQGVFLSVATQRDVGEILDMRLFSRNTINQKRPIQDIGINNIMSILNISAWKKVCPNGKTRMENRNAIRKNHTYDKPMHHPDRFWKHSPNRHWKRADRRAKQRKKAMRNL